MEHRIITRSRTAKKNVSTVDTEASLESRAGTHKSDFSERGSSLLLHEEEVTNRSSEINKDIQVGLDKIETCTGLLDKSIGGTGVTNVSIAERKSKKEQLKCLVNLFADML